MIPCKLQLDEQGRIVVHFSKRVYKLAGRIGTLGSGNMKAVLKKYRQLPWVSAILVLINVLIFLVCWFSGDLLYHLGGLSLFDVVFNREYVRVITSMFLHSDLNHIFNNMVLLFFMGSMIEKQIGHVWYAVFYFLSGIGGNLVSLLHKAMVSEWVVSVGASGAVFGLTGILLALVLFRRSRMPDMTPRKVMLMIVLSLYNGVTAGNIDNAAHVGGLITGFMLGVLWSVVSEMIWNKSHKSGGMESL